MTFGMDPLSAPALGGVAITASDSADVSPKPRALYVGGAGNVAVTFIDGSTATFNSVPAGTVLAVRVKRVLATGTTATNIVGLY